MSISSGQTLEHASGFEERQEAARNQLLAELVAALKGTDPPEDAFSVEDIMAATGWERQTIYGYLRRAKEDGTIEKVGRFGILSYYRKV